MLASSSGDVTLNLIDITPRIYGNTESSFVLQFKLIIIQKAIKSTNNRHRFSFHKIISKICQAKVFIMRSNRNLNNLWLIILLFSRGDRFGASLLGLVCFSAVGTVFSVYFLIPDRKSVILCDIDLNKKFYYDCEPNCLHRKNSVTQSAHMPSFWS